MPQRLLDCYRAFDGVLGQMLQVFAAALDLPLDYFDRMFAGHNNTLRVFNYPPLTEPPLPGQLRAGEHTDFTALTILMMDKNDPGGLQVRLKGGDWVDVRAPAGALVINIGDLLMRWTNDFWLSNAHRVVNPAGRVANVARQSFVFFANPRDDVMIECIDTCCGPCNRARYAPIRSGDYQAERLGRSRRSVEASQAGIPFDAT